MSAGGRVEVRRVAHLIVDREARPRTTRAYGLPWTPAPRSAGSSCRCTSQWKLASLSVLPVLLRTSTSGYLQILRVRTTPPPRDRKSTRLNSSHGYISYAVFCLKKKKRNK